MYIPVATMAMAVLLLHLVVGTDASPPNITAASPLLGAEGRTVMITLHGTHFHNTTAITVGGMQCNLTAGESITTPCLQIYSRQDACDIASELYPSINVGDLFPCDSSNSCLMAHDAGLSCGFTWEVGICQVQRCYYPPATQCYGFINTPDYSVCGPDSACVGGLCIDARANQCPSTISCELSSTNMLAPGSHDVAVTTGNGTTTLVGGFRIVPEPANITVDRGTVVSPGTTVAATVVGFSDGEKYNHSLALRVDGTVFTNGAPFPSLGVVGPPSAPKTVEFLVTFTDYATEPVVAALTWQILYARQPMIGSLFPPAILAVVDNEIVIQGADFVDSSAFRCLLENMPVPHQVLNANTAKCMVNVAAESYNRSGSDVLALQVTNDGVTLATTAGTLVVTGACAELKPHSTPVGGTCLCLPGHEDAGTSCIPCSDGLYQPGVGQSACIPCDGTENTGGTSGSIDKTACRCRDERFRASPDDPTCAPCGEGMECRNGTVGVREGYWRHSLDDNFVVECPGGSIGCGGGAGAGDAICNDGYVGPLCSVCAPDHGKIGDTCFSCGPAGVSVVVLVVGILLALGIIIVLIRSTVNPSKDGINLSTTLKIGANHMQLLYLVGRLSADWGSLSDRLYASTAVTSLSPSLYLQCAAQMGFYERFNVVLCVPLIVVAVVSLPYLFMRAARNLVRQRSRGASGWDTPALVRQFGTAVLIVLYLIMPAITLEIGEFFRCDDVPGTGTSYVRADMRVDCGTARYRIYYAVAWVYTIVYIVGGIALVAWRMHVNHKALWMACMLSGPGNSIYVYFGRGYQESHMLWEGVVLARKLGIVMCSAFLSRDFQLLWGFAIIMASLGITWHMNPYERLSANRLEKSALGALLMTIFIGLNATLSDRDDEIVVFVLIIFFNLAVIVFLFTTVAANLRGPVERLAKRLAALGRSGDVAVPMRSRRGSAGTVGGSSTTVHFEDHPDKRFVDVPHYNT